MKNKFPVLMLVLATLLALGQLGMARHGQYDEEARAAEKESQRLQSEGSEGKKSGHHPIRGIAQGVKQATLDNATGVLGETAESTREDAPVLGTLEGARQGTGKLLDNTVKGVAKVATLGYGEVDKYEVVEPEKNSEEPTKVRIKF